MAAILAAILKYALENGHNVADEIDCKEVHRRYLFAVDVVDVDVSVN